METKKCTKCGQTKPVDAYYKNAKAHDGLQCHCKDCQKSTKEERKYKSEKKSKSSILAPINKRPVKDESNPLSSFTPRELMQELYSRGFEGELTYTSKITLGRI